jgi:hypothetical protein
MSEEALESNRPDNLPKLSSIEEKVARYGQMALWLRNMSRWSNDKKEKAQFKLMVQLTLHEFCDEIAPLLLVVKANDRLSIEEGKRIENENREQRGKRLRNLLDE